VLFYQVPVDHNVRTHILGEALLYKNVFVPVGAPTLSFVVITQLENSSSVTPVIVYGP
jgi:hypothetical protein